MKLSELRGRASGTSFGHPDDQAGPLGHTEPAGTIHNAVAYTRPIGALYNGQSVRLIACGDITGMSPAEKFVDENGRIDWAPSDEFRVNDPNVVPQSTEQFQRLSGVTTGSRR